MTERLPWFPCYPSKLLGALAGMNADQQLVYQIVLLRIYEVWGPCADTADALANRTRMNRRRVEAALDVLFKAGKIYRDENDAIMNPIARGVMAEAEALHKRRQGAGKSGGKISAQKRKQKQENGASRAAPEPQPRATHIQKQIQLQTEGDSPPQTPPSPAAPKKTPSKTLSFLPEDWALTAIGFDYAEQKGFGRDRALDMAEHFKAFHRSKGNRMLDWHAAWQTWVRNQVKYDAERGPPRGPAPRGGLFDRPPARSSAGFADVSRMLRESEEER